MVLSEAARSLIFTWSCDGEQSASQQPGAARADPGSRPRSTRGDPPGEIHPGSPNPGRSTRGAFHPGSPPPTEPHPGSSRAAEPAMRSRWAGPSGSTTVALLTWQRRFFARWQQRIDFPGENFPRLSSTHLVTVGRSHYGFWGGPETRVRPVRHNPWGHLLEL